MMPDVSLLLLPLLLQLLLLLLLLAVCVCAVYCAALVFRDELCVCEPLRDCASGGRGRGEVIQRAVSRATACDLCRDLFAAAGGESRVQRAGAGTGPG